MTGCLTKVYGGSQTMSKWINHKINEFMGTDFTVRETEILTLGTMCTALVALIFTMYTAIFPNI